jgi:hypothetical protein
MDCPADGDEYNDADENIEKRHHRRTTVIVNGGVVKFKRRQLLPQKYLPNNDEKIIKTESKELGSLT